MDRDEERERFEKWFYNRSPHSRLEILKSEQWGAWQAARRWIPVEEELPENGQRVLFVVHFQDEQYAGTIQAGRFMVEEYGNDRYEIFSFPGRGTGATHWQPLPEPPENYDE